MQKTSRILLGMLVATLILSGCGNANEGESGGEASVGKLFEENGNNSTESESEMVTTGSEECPQITRPVCATSENEETGTTYLNACEAQMAGEERWTSGECQ